LLNDDYLPLQTLQDIFVNSFRLKRYLPTLIGPQQLIFEQDTNPVYYSLHYPSTFIFSPKSRRAPSTLNELRELERIMSTFIAEMAKENALCHGSIFATAAKNIQFDYFHNEPDPTGIVKPTALLAAEDPRLSQISPDYIVDGARCATDSSFLRGSIRIQRKSP
jgi:hypothetical protein